MKKESMVSSAIEEMRFIEVSKTKVIEGVPREFTFVLYVSNKGRVYYYHPKLKRTIELKAQRKCNPCVLSHRPNTKSYYQRVHLGRTFNHKFYSFKFFVHRLVAMAFPEICGVLKEGYQVDHINGLRDDNRAENLRCISANENLHSSEQRKKFGEAMKAAWRDSVKRARLLEGARKRVKRLRSKINNY